MKIAFIGCGFVAELYAKTLSNHSNLNMVGAFDRDNRKLEIFTKRWPGRSYTSLIDILNDTEVEAVLNLTDPRSHYEVTLRSLLAGKHVYSEKPLAMNVDEGNALVHLAEQKGLYLSSAPSSVLGETAQTMWRAIRTGVVGKIRLAYANFDDGMIAPTMAPWTWRNESGIPWPAKDEFEVGCTYEHAGYVLTWLNAFFGPAVRATSFASCQIPEKGIAVERMAPDFAVSCITYPNDVVARVTCGLVAPDDRSLTIIGDEGVISTNNVRDEVGPVYVRRIPAKRTHAAVDRRLDWIRHCLEDILPVVPWSGRDWHLQRKLPLTGSRAKLLVGGRKSVDFCRGPAEMACAISERRPCRLSARFGLHLVELIDAMQNPDVLSARHEMESTFEPIAPLVSP